jgi:hypothetical protein
MPKHATRAVAARRIEHMICSGKRADLILIDGDPTHDISNIRNVALVLQDGDAYCPAELYGELGVKPFAPALKPEPGAAAGR